jgi:phage anti-repressor protein
MENLKVLTNELIPVYENEEGKKLVSARELHEWLGNKRQFVDWIIQRIGEYNFIQATDYTSFSQNSEKGGRPKTEFIITLDMAKELSMVEKTEKGKEARQYFIKCENSLKEIVADPYKGMSPELKSILLIDKKQQALETKVENLESNMPLFNIECKELQALVKSIGTKALGGYKSQAYNNNSLRGKVYADIQRELKRQFAVNRYEAIKRSQLEVAKSIVEGYKLPLVLENQINLLNNQIAM